MASKKGNIVVIDELFRFEEEYKELYSICANGFPVYTCLRQEIYRIMQEGKYCDNQAHIVSKGRIFPRRIWDSAVKLYKFRSRKTLVFTSSIFRRDNKRNLAAEYLQENFTDAVIFEWPARNMEFDKGYLSDPLIDVYCPMDFYLVIKKIDCIINKKEYNKLKDNCRQKVENIFADRKEDDIIKYLKSELPNVYADTMRSQNIFKKIFAGYLKIEYVIDFWGAARENIIPVLPGKAEAIELQHGLIDNNHTGYIYPGFVRDSGADLFKRKIWVYGSATADLLVTKSVFERGQIRVIGNPRVNKYKQLYQQKSEKRNMILFASQPYKENDYYKVIVKCLNEFQKILRRNEKWRDFRFGVKLHPREDNIVREFYRSNLNDVIIYDNAADLYELLQHTFLHITVMSTTLYEAAVFDVPTVVIKNEDYEGVYGFNVWSVKSNEDFELIMDKLSDKAVYREYMSYLKDMTEKYM